jgi:simple sugar transport system permease protein
MDNVNDSSNVRRRGIARGPRLADWAAELRILLVAVLLAAYFEFSNRDFLLTSASLENLSQFVAPVAIIAFGEIMLMIGGDIDLSVGMVFAFAPFLMVFAADAGAPMWIAVIVGLVAAGVIGFVNGAVTVWLRLPSFVTTLGTLFLVNGITLTISHGTPVPAPGSPTFAAIMGAWGYSEILWTIGIAIVMHILLRHTRWGLHTQASGANPVGASEAGIRGCGSATSFSPRCSPA